MPRGRPELSEDVLAPPVILNDEPNIIIGVFPPSFISPPPAPRSSDVAARQQPVRSETQLPHLYGVGRLADGISVRAAEANMIAIAQQLEQQYPDSNRGQGAAVVDLTETIVGSIRPVLLLLLGGAALLLVIATVNVASLLLVRTESRTRRSRFAARSAHRPCASSGSSSPKPWFW